MSSLLKTVPLLPSVSGDWLCAPGGLILVTGTECHNCLQKSIDSEKLFIQWEIFTINEKILPKDSGNHFPAWNFEKHLKPEKPETKGFSLTTRWQILFRINTINFWERNYIRVKVLHLHIAAILYTCYSRCTNQKGGAPWRFGSTRTSRWWTPSGRDWSAPAVIAHAVWPGRRKTAACARSSRIRSRIPTLRATATVVYITKRSK